MTHLLRHYLTFFSIRDQWRDVCTQQFLLLAPVARCSDKTNSFARTQHLEHSSGTSNSLRGPRTPFSLWHLPNNAYPGVSSPIPSWHQWCDAPHQQHHCFFLVAEVHPFKSRSLRAELYPLHRASGWRFLDSPTPSCRLTVPARSPLLFGKGLRLHISAIEAFLLGEIPQDGEQASGIPLSTQTLRSGTSGAVCIAGDLHSTLNVPRIAQFWEP